MDLPHYTIIFTHRTTSDVNANEYKIASLPVGELVLIISTQNKGNYAWKTSEKTHIHTQTIENVRL